MQDEKTREELLEIIERQAKDLKVFRVGAKMLINAGAESSDPVMKVITLVVTEQFIERLSHK